MIKCNINNNNNKINSIMIKNNNINNNKIKGIMIDTNNIKAELTFYLPPDLAL